MGRKYTSNGYNVRILCTNRLDKEGCEYTIIGLFEKW
jgi:hypothetical protein